MLNKKHKSNDYLSGQLFSDSIPKEFYQKADWKTCKFSVRDSMTNSVQFYRPPRRVSASPEDEPQERNQTRNMVILFVGLVLICVILYVSSIILSQMGFHSMAIGIQMLTIILLWTSIGIGFTVGISYFVLRTFLRREFDKRFRKLEKEQHRRYREMMGLKEPSEDSE